jgi:hypothetical protein
MKRFSIAYFMAMVLKLITNCKNAEILSKLTVFGVTEATIEEGEALIAEAQKSINDQEREHNEKLKAYDEYFAQKELCEDEHKIYSTFGRLVVGSDKSLYRTLNFNEPLDGKTYERFMQMEKRYRAALNEPTFMAGIAKYNVTVDSINGYMANIEILKKLRVDYDREKGQAESATEFRKLKLEELKIYYKNLKTVAKVALREDVQLLEELGIVAK